MKAMSKQVGCAGIILVLLVLSVGRSAAQDVPPAEEQIAGAVQPAPESLREGAQVLGYAEDFSLTTLREGTSELICVADDPRDDRYHAACYHASLEPFMERGRALRAEGMARAQVDSVRRAEIEAGNLSMPEQPTALYSLTGPADSFNAETGAVTGARPLYVVYAPFATGDETGFPTAPQGSVPWLMEAGTPWAHLMIQPPQPEPSSEQ